MRRGVGTLYCVDLGDWLDLLDLPVSTDESRPLRAPVFRPRSPKHMRLSPSDRNYPSALVSVRNATQSLRRDNQAIYLLVAARLADTAVPSFSPCTVGYSSYTSS